MYNFRYINWYCNSIYTCTQVRTCNFILGRLLCISALNQFNINVDLHFKNLTFKNILLNLSIVQKLAESK